MGPAGVNNPMFHGSGGWGALQLVGKYDVLDMSDTGNQVPQATTRLAVFVNSWGLRELATVSGRERRCIK